jgi:hypothetical protein
VGRRGEGEKKERRRWEGDAKEKAGRRKRGGGKEKEGKRKMKGVSKQTLTQSGKKLARGLVQDFHQAGVLGWWYGLPSQLSPTLPNSL